MLLNDDFQPPANPWDLFREWYALAQIKEPDDTNAMSLATVGQGGRPSVRIILLKGYDENGLTFFSNRESRKGTELEQNPQAAVCLHWKNLDRQIRAEGSVSLLPDTESDAYFATRPRASQIGACASQQSRVLASRTLFEERVGEMEKQYQGRDVLRPPYWGGYRLTPLRLEFWQERPFRLHDRIVYSRAKPETPWETERLYP